FFFYFSLFFFFFFFFQAEDGIRDLIVTGVQTCALPISGRVVPDQQNFVAVNCWHRQIPPRPYIWVNASSMAHNKSHLKVRAATRSEERRVGKECRYGGWREDEKKKGEEREERRKNKDRA